MGAHDDFLDEIADDPNVPVRRHDPDAARIMRLPRSSLIRLVDRLLADSTVPHVRHRGGSSRR
jgi:uncharacterized protein (UPF0147 family)